eukprot:scaffold104423_cov33-Tisochrysis_lutea.AAC.3
MPLIRALGHGRSGRCSDCVARIGQTCSSWFLLSRNHAVTSIRSTEQLPLATCGRCRGPVGRARPNHFRPFGVAPGRLKVCGRSLRRRGKRSSLNHSWLLCSVCPQRKWPSSKAPGGRVDGRFQGLSVLFTTRGIATSTHASPLPPTPLCLFWFTPGDISTEVLEAMGELVTSLLRGMKIEPNDVAEVRGQCEPRVSKPLPLSIDVSICQVGPA